MKYNSTNNDMPFLYAIRRMRMTDTTLCSLHAIMGIDRNTLLKIQADNKTLVRTDDPERRKKLTVILNDSIFKI